MLKSVLNSSRSLSQAFQIVKTQKNFSNCTDIWQIKIMNALVKKQQSYVGTSSDSWALLSLELLNSLLMRFEMEMEKRFKVHKLPLRNFLVQPNLMFLHDYCESLVQELIQLVVFYDLSLNFFSNDIDVSSLNLFKFMFELKNRQNAALPDVDFQMNLWNLLKV